MAFFYAKTVDNICQKQKLFKIEEFLFLTALNADMRVRKLWLLVQLAAAGYLSSNLRQAKAADWELNSQ